MTEQTGLPAPSGTVKQGRRPMFQPFKKKEDMAIYEIAEAATKGEVTELFTYLAELIEATETVAKRHGIPVPRCHPHAKAAARRVGIIADAPTADGLQETRSTYAWLLCELPEALRLTAESQERLCGLRDFIAKAENRTPRDVQESFETFAALAKAELRRA